jgi:hypothetical protein
MRRRVVGGRGVDSDRPLVYKVPPRARRGLLFEGRTDGAGVDKKLLRAYIIGPPRGASRGSLKTKSSVRRLCRLFQQAKRVSNNASDDLFAERRRTRFKPESLILAQNERWRRA